MADTKRTCKMDNFNRIKLDTVISCLKRANELVLEVAAKKQIHLNQMVDEDKDDDELIETQTNVAIFEETSKVLLERIDLLHYPLLTF